MSFSTVMGAYASGGAKISSYIAGAIIGGLVLVYVGGAVGLGDAMDHARGRPTKKEWVRASQTAQRKAIARRRELRSYQAPAIASTQPWQTIPLQVAHKGWALDVAQGYLSDNDRGARSDGLPFHGEQEKAIGHRQSLRETLDGDRKQMPDFWEMHALWPGLGYMADWRAERAAMLRKEPSAPSWQIESELDNAKAAQKPHELTLSVFTSANNLLADPMRGFYYSPLGLSFEKQAKKNDLKQGLGAPSWHQDASVFEKKGGATTPAIENPSLGTRQVGSEISKVLPGFLATTRAPNAEFNWPPMAVAKKEPAEWLVFTDPKKESALGCEMGPYDGTGICRGLFSPRPGRWVAVSFANGPELIGAWPAIVSQLRAKFADFEHAASIGATRKKS